MQTVTADRIPELLAAATAARVPVMLHGSPGVGKSDMVRQGAARAGVPLIDFRANLIDPVDLRGLPRIALTGEQTTEPGWRGPAARTEWVPPDFLPYVDRDGPAGWLFIDELPTAAPAVRTALFGLVLDRFVGNYRLPDGWAIIAAGNLASDRAGASRLETALANRLLHIGVAVDPAAWFAWASRSGIHPVLIAFLRLRPGMLHKFDAKSDAVAFPTPRSWAAASRFVDLAPAIRHPLISGLVGADAAGEFESFAQTAARMPDPRAIIADPTGSPVPTDLSVQFALGTALARLADIRTVDAVMTYARRLPAEMAETLVSDLMACSPALAETSAVVTFKAATARNVL